MVAALPYYRPKPTGFEGFSGYPKIDNAFLRSQSFPAAAPFLGLSHYRRSAVAQLVETGRASYDPFLKAIVLAEDDSLSADSFMAQYGFSPFVSTDLRVGMAESFYAGSRYDKGNFHVRVLTAEDHVDSMWQDDVNPYGWDPHPDMGMRTALMQAKEKYFGSLGREPRVLYVGSASDGTVRSVFPETLHLDIQADHMQWLLFGKKMVGDVEEVYKPGQVLHGQKFDLVMTRNFNGALSVDALDHLLAENGLFCWSIDGDNSLFDSEQVRHHSTFLRYRHMRYHVDDYRASGFNPTSDFADRTWIRLFERPGR